MAPGRRAAKNLKSLKGLKSLNFWGARGSNFFTPRKAQLPAARVGLATIPNGGIARTPIELSPQTEALIRKKVKQGLYANADEAIAAAVRLLDEHDRHVTRLREAIAAGEEGEALPWTLELMDQLSRDAEEMHHRGESPDPEVRSLADPHFFNVRHACPIRQEKRA